MLNKFVEFSSLDGMLKGTIIDSIIALDSYSSAPITHYVIQESKNAKLHVVDPKVIQGIVVPRG